MKKIIQICSMLALLVAFSVISASAQTVNQLDAKIPFDFNVGGKTLNAGNYVIKISRTVTSSRILSFEDENGKSLHNVIIAERGDEARGKLELVFNRYDSQRFLSKVLIGTESFSVLKSDTEKQIAAGERRRDSKTEVAGLRTRD